MPATGQNSREGYITKKAESLAGSGPGMDPHRQPSANVHAHCVVDPLSVSSLTSHVAQSRTSEARRAIHTRGYASAKRYSGRFTALSPWIRKKVWRLTSTN